MFFLHLQLCDKSSVKLYSVIHSSCAVPNRLLPATRLSGDFFMRSFLSMTASIFILILASYSPANAQGISGFIFASYYECDPGFYPALADG